MKKFKFVDAQKMAKEHPGTFEAPSKEDLKALKKGDTVKVCINGERFWTVIEKIEKNKIVALVANILISTPAELGDRITFEKRHVYSIF